MQVYIECEESRKNDFAYGEWVDVGQTEEEIDTDIQAILDESPVDSKGFVITDCEDFAPLKIPEKYPITDLVELADLVEEHGGVFLHYADHVGIGDATGDDFEEAYAGEWDSEEKFAEELFDDIYLHEVPENLQHYIDYSAFAHDLFMCDYYMLDDRFVFGSY